LISELLVSQASNGCRQLGAGSVLGGRRHCFHPVGAASAQSNKHRRLAPAGGSECSEKELKSPEGLLPNRQHAGLLSYPSRYCSTLTVFSFLLALLLISRELPAPVRKRQFQHEPCMLNESLI